MKKLWIGILILKRFAKKLTALPFLLIIVSLAEGLRDSSGKPGEDLCVAFVPDLKRIARTEANQNNEK